MTGFSKFAYANVPAQYAFAGIAASQTAASLVTAVAGKKIRVLALAFVCGATATTATFNSDGGAISMLFANAANGGAILPFNPVGWFETDTGEALTLTTGTGSTTGVNVVYVKYG